MQPDCPNCEQLKEKLSNAMVNWQNTYDLADENALAATEYKKKLDAFLIIVKTVEHSLELALSPLSKCEPTVFRSVDPKDTFLWKPASTMGDVQGISAQDIINCKQAYNALQELRRVREELQKP